MSSPHVSGEAVFRRVRLLPEGQLTRTSPVCQHLQCSQYVGPRIECFCCHAALSRSSDARDLFGHCHDEVISGRE